jgi:molybdenum cofactor cytidylyltransferase
LAAPVRIAGLVLAAGASTRMGAVKALLRHGDGRTFVRALCDALLASGAAPVVCVLGHHREALAAELSSLPAVRLVVNPDPSRGQVSSMALGLAACAEASATHAVVALVDHPPPRPATLRALLDAASAHPGDLHVPVCDGQRGHPVIFPVSLAIPLAGAGVGEGARAVIARLGLTVRLLPVDDRAVLLDLDTPEDLAAFRAASRLP